MGGPPTHRDGLGARLFMRRGEAPPIEAPYERTLRAKSGGAHLLCPSPTRAAAPPPRPHPPRRGWRLPSADTRPTLLEIKMNHAPILDSVEFEHHVVIYHIHIYLRDKIQRDAQTIYVGEKSLSCCDLWGPPGGPH